MLYHLREKVKIILRQTCSFILVYDNRIVKFKIVRYERINNVETLLSEPSSPFHLEDSNMALAAFMEGPALASFPETRKHSPKTDDHVQVS